MSGMATTIKNNPKSQEVWLVKFPYEENNKKYKKRPVIVIDETTGNEIQVLDCLEEPNYLSTKVTSKEVRRDDIGDTIILKWKEANLKKPSVARVSKTINIPLSQFINKIGNATDEDFENILQTFMRINNL